MDLKILNETSNLGLFSQGRSPLEGFVDFDFAGNIDTRRSLTGYMFTLYGSVISWKALLQSVVALSTIEVEYIAMTEAVREAMWLKGIIKEFRIDQGAVRVHCDNQSTIHLSKHQVFHERSKQPFVRDAIDKGVVKVQKIGTEDNPTDMIAKALPSSKFKHCEDLVKLTEWDVP